jgi:SRSO17 transposase
VSRSRGRQPQRPWQSVEQWSQALSDDAWKRIDVRDESQGPLVVEVVKRRVVSRTHRRQQGHEERVVVMRYRDRDNQQVVKIDYSLSKAAPETPLWQFAPVAKAEHRIEDCRQHSKSEAGLADYEVRHWTGWQQHQTLSLLATWFLVQETERGKKRTPAMTLPQIRQGIAVILRKVYQCDTRAHLLDTCQKRLQRNELARFYH